MMTFWRTRGKIIRTVLCCIAYQKFLCLGFLGKLFCFLCIIRSLFCCQYQRNRLPGKTRLRNDQLDYVSSGTLNSKHSLTQSVTHIIHNSTKGLRYYLNPYITNYNTRL